MTTQKNRPKKGRFMHARYAQILAQVMACPVTVPEVVAQHQIGAQVTREILWRMERLGLVRVCEWREPAPRSSYMTAVFGAADGRVSLPYPRQIAKRVYSAAMGQPRSELTAFAAMVRVLQEGATRQQVHDQTGVAYMRVSRLIRVMRSLGICHRSDWIVRDSGAGCRAEVFSFGPGKDAPALKTLGRKEIDRRSAERKKQRGLMLRMIHATAGRLWAGMAEGVAA